MWRQIYIQTTPTSWLLCLLCIHINLHIIISFLLLSFFPSLITSWLPNKHQNHRLSTSFSIQKAGSFMRLQSLASHWWLERELFSSQISSIQAWNSDTKVNSIHQCRSTDSIFHHRRAGAGFNRWHVWSHVWECHWIAERPGNLVPIDMCTMLLLIVYIATPYSSHITKNQRQPSICREKIPTSHSTLYAGNPVSSRSDILFQPSSLLRKFEPAWSSDSRLHRGIATKSYLH